MRQTSLSDDGFISLSRPYRFSIPDDCRGRPYCCDLPEMIPDSSLSTSFIDTQTGQHSTPQNNLVDSFRRGSYQEAFCSIRTCQKIMEARGASSRGRCQSRAGNDLSARPSYRGKALSLHVRKPSTPQVPHQLQ